MPPIVIPRGKRLSLVRGDTPVTGNVPLILEEEVTLTLSSSFKPLVSGGSNTLIDFLGNISQNLTGVGFSSQFAEFGFQIWEKTDPLSFNATVTFRIGITGKYNAFEEVYRPAMELASLPLPSTGRSVAGGTLENLIPPGPPGTAIVEVESFKGKYRPISMQIGGLLYISQIIVMKAEPTFSTETDENNYPIWARVNIDIQSVETATVEMLQNRNRAQFEQNNANGGG